MRLDEALVVRALLPSRSRAKRAVLAGQVTVDGDVVTKPSHRTAPGAELALAGEAALPRGHGKLAAIDHAHKIVHQGDVVLDIGSSAGGFALYCSPRVARVFGIEVACEFGPALEAVAARCPNVAMTFADAFTVDPADVTGGASVTLMLNDLTVDPQASLGVTARFLPLLATGGRLLQVLKAGDLDHDALEHMALTWATDHSIEVMHVIPGEGRELYVVGRKVV